MPSESPYVVKGARGRRSKLIPGSAKERHKHAEMNPHRMLRTDLAVAALFLSGHAPDRDARAHVVTVGRFLAFAVFGCSTLLFLFVQDGCQAAI